MDKQIIDIENVLQNWEHYILSTLPKIIDGIAVFILFFILAHLTKFICNYFLYLFIYFSYSPEFSLHQS